MLETPVVILLFGPSGAGKSTVGHLVAGSLPRCAFIEVDVLRYMVVGGLVAYSGGISPNQAPKAYRQQCWMGVDNAVRLAKGFVTGGFSSVIEGLEDDCRPGTGWADRVFENQPVFNAALVCAEDELTRRWQIRGWGSVLPHSVYDELDWYRAHLGLFGCVIDTSTTTPEQTTVIIIRHIVAEYG